MKSLLKFFTLAFTVFFIVGLFNASEADAAEKIYREYKLPADRTKFPIQTANGLTVSSKVIGANRVPVISKGSTVLWTGAVGSKSNSVRFAVTKNDDLYLYYKSSLKNKDSLQLVGVSKSGNVFMDSSHSKNNYRLNVDFISPSLLEIQYDHFTDYGDYFSKYYQIYVNGNMKELPYVDIQFFKQLKAGKLKWMPGKIGAQLGSFRSKVDALAPIYSGSSKGYVSWYSNWQAEYFFLASGAHVKNNQKVRNITKYNIIASRKKIGPLLKQHLGKPIFNSKNEVLVYRFGKYTLVVSYSPNNITSFYLWDTPTYKMYTSP